MYKLGAYSGSGSETEDNLQLQAQSIATMSSDEEIPDTLIKDPTTWTVVSSNLSRTYKYQVYLSCKRRKSNHK